MSAPRPWYRLHRSTCLLALVPAAVLTVLIVPSEPVPFSEGPRLIRTYRATHQMPGGAASVRPARSRPIDAQQRQIHLASFSSVHLNSLIAANAVGQCYFSTMYEHGWPWTHLAYEGDFYTQSGVSWLKLETWSYSAHWREIRFGPLATNLLAALAIFLSFLTAMEWRRRRLAHLWQFTLLDLLLLMLLVSLGAGWWQHERRAFEREQDVLAKLDLAPYSHSVECLAPRWLTKTTGRSYPGIFYRVARLHLEPNHSLPNSGAGFFSVPDADVEVAERGKNPVENLRTRLRSLRPNLSEFTHLRELSFSDNFHLTDSDLEQLDLPASLEVLDLSEQTIFGSGLTGLRNLPRLRVLRLAGCPLRDRALEEIAKLDHLDSVDPGAIDDVTLPQVAKFLGRSKLKDLHFTTHVITDADLKALAEHHVLKWLVDRDALPIFGYFGCSVHDTDANPPRLRIDLSKTNVTNEGLQYLTDFAELEELDLSYMSQISDAGLRRLAGMKHLKELLLPGTSITDACFADLARLPALERLDVSEVQEMTDAGLAKLAKAKQLKELALPAGITDAGLAHVADFAALEKLDLSETAGVTDAGLAHLARLQHLKEVHLPVTGISEAGLAYLAELPSLEKLELANIDGITDASVHRLTHTKRFKELFLNGIKIDESELAELRHTVQQSRAAADADEPTDESRDLLDEPLSPRPKDPEESRDETPPDSADPENSREI